MRIIDKAVGKSALCLVFLAGLPGFAAYGATAPELVLPAGQVVVDVAYTPAGDSTYLMTFQGLGGGYDISGTPYRGWCVEDNGKPDNFLVTLYSSYDSAAPLDLRTYQEPSIPVVADGGAGLGDAVPWDKLNYLLNHKQGGMIDIQSAVWQLVWGDSSSWSLTPIGAAMVSDAEANGAGFVPGSGQTIGVLLYIDGLGWNGFQETVIEVPVPDDGSCPDADGDGTTACDGDCDDHNAAVHPGASELCDRLDNDCDGLVDEGFDVDGDGFASCNGDCDDHNPAVHPGASELCDRLDNDCDGLVDEGFDVDGDGFASCNGDCDDHNPAVHPGASELCNGRDDNCDGVIDDTTDADGDGFTTCNGDCDDHNPGVHPGASELCNGRDDDCDGGVDEGSDADGDGFTTCNGDCDDHNPAVHPGVQDVCDGKDNNCDGVVDEGTGGQGGLEASYHDAEGSMSTIDPSNGHTTPMSTGSGPIATGLQGVTAMTVNPANGLTYLVTGDGDDSLYTLNPATGAVVRIGPLSHDASDIQAMDFAPSLAQNFGFAAGGLYGVSIDGFGNCGPNCLFRIDPTTAEATPLGAVAANQIRGISFSPATGKLWAYDPGGKVLSTVAVDGKLTYQFTIPSSSREFGTGVDTAFSLAHGCDGQLYTVDIAYGVLLWIDVATHQAYWVDEFGSAASASGSFQVSGLDSVMDGMCTCTPPSDPVSDPAVTPTPDPITGDPDAGGTGISSGAPPEAQTDEPLAGNGFGCSLVASPAPGSAAIPALLLGASLWLVRRRRS